MAKDQSLAGKITNATLHGLKVAVMVGTTGGIAFAIGQHFWKEATAPACSEDIKLTKTDGVQSALIKLKDDSLCKLTL